MKKCTHVLAIAALFGLTSPLLATPHVAAADTAPVQPTKEDIAELEESSEWTWGIALGLDACSKQLTYGLIDNPHAILTPSAELSYGHDDYFTLALGAEAIFDTTNFGAKDGGYNNRKYKYQELAFGLTLAKTFDTSDAIGSVLDTAVNYTYEYHPRSCNKPAMGWENPDTQWLNFEVSAPDYWLVPTFALEYNVDDQQDAKGAIYATFDVHHEFDIGTEMGLDEGFMTLTPTLGFGMGNQDRNEADFGDYYAEAGKEADNFMLRDAYGVLELSINPLEGFSITPYAGFHQQIDSDARDATGDDDFVAYAGIGFSYEM